MLPETPTRVWLLLMGAFAAQGVARGRAFGANATAAGIVVWALASLVICGALIWWCRPGSAGACSGLRLVLVGTLLNVVVVLLNQGMPAASAVGVDRAVTASQGFYVHLNAGTMLPFLADTVVVDGLGTHFMVSVGDLVLMVGVCVAIVGLMLESTRSALPSGMMSSG